MKNINTTLPEVSNSFRKTTEKSDIEIPNTHIYMTPHFPDWHGIFKT